MEAGEKQKQIVGTIGSSDGEVFRWIRATRIWEFWSLIEMHCFTVLWLMSFWCSRCKLGHFWRFNATEFVLFVVVKKAGSPLCFWTSLCIAWKGVIRANTLHLWCGGCPLSAWHIFAELGMRLSLKKSNAKHDVLVNRSEKTDLSAATESKTHWQLFVCHWIWDGFKKYKNDLH